LYYLSGSSGWGAAVEAEQVVELLLDRGHRAGPVDWWLGANAWLAAVPADVLGVVNDSVLIATAHAETAG
jgi:hypothetical protein